VVPLAGVKERYGIRVTQKLGEGECLVFTRIFPFRFPQTFGKSTSRMYRQDGIEASGALGLNRSPRYICEGEMPYSRI
jgi:hypothetical protein